MMRYIKHVLIAIDQLGTTLVGGWPDETLSSYAYRLELQRKPFGFMRRVIDCIFFWQPSHCYDALIAESERRQLPPALRDSNFPRYL